MLKLFQYICLFVGYACENYNSTRLMTRAAHGSYELE